MPQNDIDLWTCRPCFIKSTSPTAACEWLLEQINQKLSQLQGANKSDNKIKWNGKSKIFFLVCITYHVPRIYCNYEIIFC